MARRSQVQNAIAAAPAPKKPFSFGEGSEYLSLAELAQSKESMMIHSVAFQVGAGFEGSDRWLIKVAIEGESGISLITMGANEKRNDVFDELASHMKETGKPYGPVVVAKAGNAYYFNDVKEDAADEVPF